MRLGEMKITGPGSHKRCPDSFKPTARVLNTEHDIHKVSFTSRPTFGEGWAGKSPQQAE